MNDGIKNKINQALFKFTQDIDRDYSLKKISPLLSAVIKNFVLRQGKRSRPILFVAGYLGFAPCPCPGLFRSALSIELLHDFMLIHDDIIDKSDTRRGQPSMHRLLDNYLAGFKKLKFDGKDLAIVVGDVLYAMAIDTFLAIKENPLRKEKALKKFIEAASFTGSGEFIELIYGAKDISRIKKSDIYKIYNYKTAFYTFACPLCVGAILAGASQKQIKAITQFGLKLGIAFQIKDDILGIFSEEKKTGKSQLADLQEAKKTALVWYAYNHAGTKDKKMIRRIMSKEKINRADLLKMRSILVNAGALKFAKNEINLLLKQAQELIDSCRLKPRYKKFLFDYSRQILS